VTGVATSVASLSMGLKEATLSLNVMVVRKECYRAVSLTKI
jgi:hypothetical protein